LWEELQKKLFSTNFEFIFDFATALLKKQQTRLEALGFFLTVTQEVVDFLISVGFNKHLGARPLRAAVEKFLGDLVTQQILNGLPTSGVIKVNSLKTGLSLEAS
jgi:ATP-dependent Clp protease ATP-binding subunit ClpC